MNHTEDMLSRGRHPRSEWTSRSEGTVMPKEALALGLSPGRPVYRLSRIRYADGQSMALEHSTVPRDSVEFTKSYYRGDAYDFVAELNVARG